MNRTYQSLRSLARQYSIEDSLPHIWAYARRIRFGTELPAGYHHFDGKGEWIDVKKHLHEFQLELLLREIFLNGSHESMGQKSLAKWDDLAALWNMTNKFSESFDIEGADNIMMVMHRIGHQQISLQEDINAGFIGRYFALYNQPPLRTIFETHTDSSIREYFLMAFCTYASVLQSPRLNTKTNFNSLKIDHRLTHNFFSRLSIPLKNLRSLLIKNQSFSVDWAFTFNDYHGTPLVSLDPRCPDQVYCPMPSLLGRRLFQGLFYDISNAPGFTGAFGIAFENHIGTIFKRCCPSFLLIAPEPYLINRSLKHGMDWILSDTTANIFIECKTMRIRVTAKSAIADADLLPDLDRLADAVVQNYSNIMDARLGLTNWIPNENPCYSLVATLEDWLLFSPAATGALRTLVNRKLDEKFISRNILDEVPYVIASAIEIQKAAATFHANSIQKIMSAKVAQNTNQWLVSSFLLERYTEASVIGDQIFDLEYNEVVADINAVLEQGPVNNA